MTLYEKLHADLIHKRFLQTISLVVPALIAASIVLYSTSHTHLSDKSLIYGILTFILSPLLFHGVWLIVFRTYRQLLDGISKITSEITTLRVRVDAIFDEYRERQKGEQFKKAYDLAGKSLRELEEALSVGMYKEGREVFVTAFMRKDVAIRVTASIGSPNRCTAGDNPSTWKTHIDRLDCDEIRQYHNHPVHNGKTQSTPPDIRTSQTIKTMLGPHGSKLRSLIICWNAIREWKVFEFDDKGRFVNISEFDAAT